MLFLNMSSTLYLPPDSNESAAYVAVRRLVTERSGRQWCLFIDRDGVINRQIIGDYVRQWSDFEWLPSARRGLRLLRDWAPRLVVVTNQQGVGKGLMSADDLDTIHQNLQHDLASDGVVIDAVRACPHLESACCACRKPRPGLILGWLEEYPDVDSSLCIVIGDSQSDIGLARQVAYATGECASILIGQPDQQLPVDATFDSLGDFANAVDRIRSEERFDSKQV
jgi:histidinol-phosphate phosphatase family protein